MECLCVYDRLGRLKQKCERCKAEHEEYKRLQREGNVCSCGEDEYGRRISGECDFCKKQENEEKLYHQRFIEMNYEIKGFGNKLINEWRPDMMAALEISIRHSKNNPAAVRALEDMKNLLNPIIKFKSDKNYRIHYDPNGALAEVFKKS